MQDGIKLEAPEPVGVVLNAVFSFGKLIFPLGVVNKLTGYFKRGQALLEKTSRLLKKPLNTTVPPLDATLGRWVSL